MTQSTRPLVRYLPILKSNSPSATASLGPLTFCKEGLLVAGPHAFHCEEPISLALQDFQVSRRKGATTLQVIAPSGEQFSFRYLALEDRWEQILRHTAPKGSAWPSNRVFRELCEQYGLAAGALLWGLRLGVNVAFRCWAASIGLVVSSYVGHWMTSLCWPEAIDAAAVHLAYGIPVVFGAYLLSELRDGLRFHHTLLHAELWMRLFIEASKIAAALAALAAMCPEAARATIALFPKAWGRVYQLIG